MNNFRIAKEGENTCKTCIHKESNLCVNPEVKDITVTNINTCDLHQCKIDFIKRKIVSNMNIIFDKTDENKLLVQKLTIIKVDNCSKKEVIKPLSSFPVTHPEKLKIYWEKEHQQVKEYTKEDMNQFADWYMKNTGRFTNDSSALANGEYLKMWNKTKK